LRINNFYSRFCLPAAGFLINARLFFSFENYRVRKFSVFKPEITRRKTVSSRAAFGRVKRGRARTLWGEPVRVIHSAELMSPDVEKLENEKIFSRQNEGWRIFAPFGEFLRRNLIRRRLRETPAKTRFTSQFFRARFSLANFCKKL
jgi:hypothetical protein